MGAHPGPPPVPQGTAAGRTAVTVSAVPVVGEVLARLGAPVVTRLTLTGGDRPLRDVRVTVAVTTDDGPLGAPVELRCDLEPGRTVTLTDVPLLLDAGVLAARTAPGIGTVEVVAECDGELVGRAGSPVTVLAAGSWLAAPLPLALETLAAHVQPGDPAVAALVGAATDTLYWRTGDASVAGAASAERVDQTAAAIVEAMRRRGIRAAVPTPDWATLAQPLRTPSQVLEDRIGSSLDTVVVLAAALEHAGLRPLLWICADHAFLGYWRTDRGADQTATTEVTGLADLVHRGEVQLVETTMLTSRAASATFGDLHRIPATTWLTGDRHGVLGVTDVHRARADGVHPLPLRTPGPDRRPAAPQPPADPLALPDGVRDALLELGPGTVALGVRSLRLPTLADLLAAGTALTLLPADQLGAAQRARGIRAGSDLPPHQLAELLERHAGIYTDLPQVAYLPRLRELTARARAAVARTGAAELHLALGSVAWEREGRPVRSPLLLVPVVLTPVPGSDAHRVSAAPGGAPAYNDCLLAELRDRFGVDVPADGTVPDLAADLGALRSALALAGLPHRVEPTADLALVPAAALRTREDAVRAVAEPGRPPLVSTLLHPAPGWARDAEPPTAGTSDLEALADSLPLPADGAQLRAVATALAGETTVLSAAPGTGAVQTVAALTAAAVAESRRVLVVAARPAALAALADRLGTAGLAGRVQDLSGAATPRTSRPAVATTTADLGAARRVLAAHAARLHTPNSAGLSLYRAHGALLHGAPDAPVLPVPEAFVATASARTTAAVRRVLAGLPAVADPTRPRPGHPWGFLDDPELDPVVLADAVVAVDAALALLPPAGPLARVAAAAMQPEDLDAVVTVLSGVPVPLAELDRTGLPDWAETVDQLVAEVAAFVALPHPGLDVALPEALDQPLVELAESARAAAASGRIGRAKRLAAVRELIAPVLLPDAAVDPAELPELTASLLEVQTAMRELATYAGDVAGLRVPWSWNPLLDPGLVERQVARLRELRAAMDRSRPFTPALRRYLDTDPPHDPAAAATVTALRDALAGLLAVVRPTPERWAQWCGTGFVPRWETTQDERAMEEFGLPSLGRWRDLLQQLRLLEAAGLSELRGVLLTGGVAAADAAAAFDRGLAVTSLAERSAAGGPDAGADLDAAVRDHLAAARALRAAVVPGDGQVVLASPDAVARLLPPGADGFDLVVVDGGLPVVAGLGALSRARTAVVVGDPLAAAPGDLATACLAAGVPRRDLTVHHASRDESLVSFADRTYLSGLLATLPSPTGPAVSLRRVPEAVLRGAGELQGTNPAEAHAVVAEVRRRSGRPVTVVTLTEPQRALIEQLLRDHAEPGQVTVAPVTDVPAAEVVLFSLGCAPDADGDLPADFGPLSRPGGERWLAGAVARASREVVVFASFDPAQLRDDATAMTGVRHLRAWLDVLIGAATLPRALAAPDPHREDVAAALRARGLVVRTDVGLSSSRLDLTVAPAETPERPVLAVLLDGPAWAAQPTVADGLPDEALRDRLGWPAVARVWLPAWLADREAVLDRLVAAVEAVPAAVPSPAEEDPGPEVPRVPVPPPAHVPRPATAPAEPVRTTARPSVGPAVLAGERPFVPWTPPSAGSARAFRELDDPAVAAQVRRVLVAGIAAEGPVHRDRLVQLTAAAFGVARVNAERTAEVLALLPDAEAEFRWPEGVDPATWTGFRRQAGFDERPLEHVAPEELGNAMVALCRAGAGMTRDELFARTLAVFGHPRRHPVLVPYLERALATAVRASRVTREPAGPLIIAA
ncbi:DUF4011 domain-containing protein [Modestobacter muralis]|uniref:DUF4011 domain-containing protein n=1 Tax=Modestobacter muralis TaxID=1608614 RepID=A0A6P0H335_9ACTN|nr:DUF4011 domain-containing protein [Modestobacter muralis]NEK92736.1 DUF4011 domain-containing protein [Modestobacter muralis]NEN49503.1 DUF4011 domain-containing protein [Modestobacter muralis]